MDVLSRCLLYTAFTGIILTHCGGCGDGKQKNVPEREIRVTVQPLQKRLFRHQIPVQGTVWPVEYATVSAKISGTLELLKVDEGDACKKGDGLFGIDRQILKNQVAVCEDEIKVKQAELESAKIALQSAEILEEKAAADYKRFLSLWSSKATSKSEFETYETNYKKAETDVNNAKATILNAEAKLKQSEGNLVIAKKNLDDSIAYAPFDCVVTDKYVEVNEYVTTGQNVLRLENPQKKEVVGYISAGYYDLVKVDTTPVQFLLDGELRGKGVITYKSPSIDPESRTFKFKALVPTDITLVSGSLCDLNIILTERESYGLPSDALLLRANNRYIAYVIDENKRARSVDMTRGIVDGKYCEILNADHCLKERFVVTGQTFVNNGSLLHPINEKQ